MSNSIIRATENKDKGNSEENAKKLKAFRSELYQNIERPQDKKNAFTLKKNDSASQKSDGKSRER